MKINVLTLSLALGLPLAALAQSAPNKSYFGINAGASYATGTFRSTDAENEQAGFAKTGFHVALDGAHFFGGGPLGLAGQVAFSDNGRLLADDLAKLGAAYTEAFDVDYSTVRASGRYRRLTALVGPTFMFGPQKFKVEVRGLAGVQQLLGTPEITVQLEDNPATTFTQRSSHSLTFGYAAGLGLHYYFSDRLGLVARGEFQGSSPATIHNDNRTTATGRLSEKQPITAFTSTLGLAFTLGGK
ncbi:outer membrane beta-barrel protein [Hymenobacter sp. RP-2-7]|uniref:Outer membrane beta-barrel protein n=1 Tax=Hymenobacter polaris TaxID=2682546 RepID=A0A7Y0FLB6_9BACT|nr:outer membrane beta-barrel protein [Hymenobacter polaris]NML64216.1 outer membrane beta-barrel protein [Hymenobacter polaris]